MKASWKRSFFVLYNWYVKGLYAGSAPLIHGHKGSTIICKQCNLVPEKEGRMNIGANIIKDGTQFKVWAPNAKEVHVIGDFNEWNKGADQNPWLLYYNRLYTLTKFPTLNGNLCS